MIECLYQWSYKYPRSSTNKDQYSVFTEAVSQLERYNISRIERLGQLLFDDPLADIEIASISSQQKHPSSSQLQTPRAAPTVKLDQSMKVAVHRGLHKMRDNGAAFTDTLNHKDDMHFDDVESLFNLTIELYSTLKPTFGVVASSSDVDFENERKAILNERHFINNSHILFVRFKKGEMNFQQFRHWVGVLHTNYVNNIKSQELNQETPVILEAVSAPLSPKEKAFVQGNFFDSPENPKSEREEIKQVDDFFDFKKLEAAQPPIKQEQDIFTSFGFPQIIHQNQDVRIEVDQYFGIQQPIKVESPPDDNHVEALLDPRDPNDNSAIGLIKSKQVSQLSRIEESHSGGHDIKTYKTHDLGAIMNDPNLSIPSNIRDSVGKIAAARANLHLSHPEFETSGMGVRNSLQSSFHQSRINLSHQSGRNVSNVKIGSKKSVVSSMNREEKHSHHNKVEWFDPVPDFAKLIEPDSGHFKNKQSDGSKNHVDEFFSVRSIGERKVSYEPEPQTVNSVWDNSISLTPDKVLEGHNGITQKQFHFTDNNHTRAQLETIKESPKTYIEQDTPHNGLISPTLAERTPQSQEVHSKLPRIQSLVVRHSPTADFGSVDDQGKQPNIENRSTGMKDQLPHAIVAHNQDNSHLISKINRLESMLVEKDLQSSIEKRERAEEVDSLNSTLAKLTQDNLNLKKSSMSLTAIDANLHDQLSILIREKASLSTDVKQKDIQINNLKQQVEALFYESTEKINSQNNLIEQLTQKQQELTKENRQLSTANSRLGLVAHSSAGTDDLVSKLEDQVISLKGQLTASQIELNQTKANSAGIEHLGKDQEAFYHACQEQVEKIRANFESTVKQISEAHDRESVQTGEAHRSEVRRLTQKVKDLEKQIMSQTIMSISKINLTPASPSIRNSEGNTAEGRRINFNDPVHQHGQAQIDRLEEELLQAKQDLIRKEVDIGYLRDDVARKDNQLDAAQSRIEKQTKELSENKEASLQQLHTYYAKEKALQESNRKLGELMKKYTDLLKSLETREHESAMLRKELNEYHSRLMRITDKHASEIASMSRGSHHDLELSKLRDINDMNDKKIVELVENGLQVRHRIVELETDIEIMNKSMQTSKDLMCKTEAENHKIKEVMFLQKKKIVGIEERLLDGDIAIGQAARLKQEISFYKVLLKEMLPRMEDLGMGSLTKDVERLINASLPVFTIVDTKQVLTADEESITRHGIDEIHLKTDRLHTHEQSERLSAERSVRSDSIVQDAIVEPEKTTQVYESVWKSQRSLTASMHETKFEIRDASMRDESKKSMQIKPLGKTVSFSVQDNEPLPLIVKIDEPQNLEGKILKPQIDTVHDYRQELESMIQQESDREFTKETCLNRSGMFFQNEFVNFFLEGISRDAKTGHTLVHTRLVVAGPTTVTDISLKNHSMLR